MKQKPTDGHPWAFLFVHWITEGREIGLHLAAAMVALRTQPTLLAIYDSEQQTYGVHSSVPLRSATTSIGGHPMKLRFLLLLALCVTSAPAVGQVDLERKASGWS